MRPSTPRGRIDHGRRPRGTEDRLARDDDERVTCDPQAHRPLECERALAGVPPRPPAGPGAGWIGTSTAVSMESSSERPISDLIAARGRSRNRAPLIDVEHSGHSERDVALPAVGLCRCGLVQAGRIEEQGQEECDGDDHERVTGGAWASIDRWWLRPAPPTERGLDAAWCRNPRGSPRRSRPRRRPRRSSPRSGRLRLVAGAGSTWPVSGSASPAPASARARSR